MSIIPKLSTPNLFLHTREIFEHYRSRNTLYDLDNLYRKILRRDRQKQINMIILYPHRTYLKFIPFRYFLKDRLKPFFKFTSAISSFDTSESIPYNTSDHRPCNLYILSGSYPVYTMSYHLLRTCFHPLIRAEQSLFL